MKTREVDIKRLGNENGLEFYTRCPKITTAIRHAEHADDTEFHTIWTGYTEDEKEGPPALYCVKRVFSIPEQKLVPITDTKYGEYLIIRVNPQFNISSEHSGEFLLFINMGNPTGFLTPSDVDIGKYEILKTSLILEPSILLQKAICSSVWFSRDTPQLT